MKQIYKYFLGAIIILSITVQQLNAQVIGGDAAIADDADVTRYLGNYFEPFIISTSNGLANGWNNTARPHKLFGFDITTTVSIAGIPDAAYNFQFVNKEYNTLRIQGTTDPEASAQVPTFAGGDPTQGLQLEAYDPETGISTSDAYAPPPGIDLSQIPIIRAGVPVPMANIGLGLPKNTEIRVRFIPLSNVGDDVSVKGSFGIGVLHDIKQWIPGMKLVPMDLSVFVGYNQFNFAYEDVDGNMASFNSKATTIQVLASKKLLFFTPYIGVGTNIIGSNFSYAIKDPDTGASADGEFDYDKLGGARLMIGGRLKILWVLSLNVDYTIQRYNTLNVGFGINIR